MTLIPYYKEKLMHYFALKIVATVVLSLNIENLFRKCVKKY